MPHSTTTSPGAQEPVLLNESDDGIAVLTLNRPAKLNSLDPELVCRLADAWDQIAADPTVRVVVVTGAGDRAFCTGADLGRLIPLFTGARPVQDEWDRRLQADPRLLDKALLRRTDFAVPVIAAVRGFALSAVPSPKSPSDDAAAQTAAPREAAAGSPVLVVAVPRAAPGFDSARMVYLRQPQQLETFALHEWVDTPARMLAPLLVRSLQASGAFGAVLLAPTTGSGSWRLETELIRLQQDFTQAPSQVRLTLRAVLVDSSSRQVIAWREFDESVPATTDDPAGGAAAAHLATQRVLAALAAFCAAQPRR